MLTANRTIYKKVIQEKQILFKNIDLDNKNIYLIDFENTQIFDFNILKNENNVCLFFIGVYQKSYFPRYIQRLKNLFSVKANIIDIYANKTGPNYLDNILSLYCGKITSLFSINKVYIISNDGDYSNIPDILTETNVEFKPNSMGEDEKIFYKGLMYADDIEKIKYPTKDKNKKNTTLIKESNYEYLCNGNIKLNNYLLNYVFNNKSIITNISKKEINWMKNYHDKKTNYSQDELLLLVKCLNNSKFSKKKNIEYITFKEKLMGQLVENHIIEKNLTTLNRKNIWGDIIQKLTSMNIITIFILGSEAKKINKDITFYVKINCL